LKNLTKMVVPNMLAFKSNLEIVFYIVLRTRALAHRFFTFTPNLANPPPRASFLTGLPPTSETSRRPLTSSSCTESWTRLPFPVTGDDMNKTLHKFRRWLFDNLFCVPPSTVKPRFLPTGVYSMERPRSLVRTASSSRVPKRQPGQDPWTAGCVRADLSPSVVAIPTRGPH